jgi:hypothetical protein
MLRAEIGGILKEAIRLHETGPVAAENLSQVLAADPGRRMPGICLRSLVSAESARPGGEAAGRATARPKIAPYWLTRATRGGAG